MILANLTLSNYICTGEYIQKKDFDLFWNNKYIWVIDKTGFAFLSSL